MNRSFNLIHFIYCLAVCTLVQSAPSKVAERELENVELHVFANESPQFQCPAYPIISTTEDTTGKSSSNVLLTYVDCLYRPNYNGPETFTLYKNSELTVVRLEYDALGSTVARNMSLEIDKIIIDPKFNVASDPRDETGSEIYPMALIYLKKPVDGVKALTAAKSRLTNENDCHLRMWQGHREKFGANIDTFNRLANFTEEEDILSSHNILPDRVHLHNLPHASLICKVDGKQVLQGLVFQYGLRQSSCITWIPGGCEYTFTFDVEILNVAYHHDWIERMLNKTRY